MNSLDLTLINPIEKITLEKRKRNQLYITMDYILSVVSLFDFFSIDSFTIIKDSNYLKALTDEKYINSDLILFSFLNQNLKIAKILTEYGISLNSLIPYVVPLKNISVKDSETLLDSIIDKLQSLRKKSILIDVKKKLNYSSEVQKIFEKATENALIRFKTPVVSSEILFITLMEETDGKFSKILKSLINNETEWFILRYRLLKELHSQESIIKGDVVKNQHYFAYLLKTAISEKDYDRLIKKDSLSSAVSVFRNFVIADLLKINLFDTLSEEILNSIQLENKRKYSSI